VLFGPGSIEVAHRPNEFMPAAELARAGELLEALVYRRCLAG
jgi:acetylornithine deacetylase/succinyl-diaminopimelate desuccinylase-like protein